MTSGLRRPSKKKRSSRPSTMRKSERHEKRNPVVPVKRKLELGDEQKMPSLPRRSERGEKNRSLSSSSLEKSERGSSSLNPKKKKQKKEENVKPVQLEAKEQCKSNKKGEQSGASSAFAQVTNTRKQVEFNQVGQPIGENAASFSTFSGQLARTYCPITYGVWHNVPDVVKDNIWSMVLGTYDIEEKHKQKVLQKVNKLWRGWKCYLRKHYDMYDQDAERKRNCPNGVKQEEWDNFIDLESMEQSKIRREKGKASRREMKHPHMTGRRGAARTAEKMQKENPDTVVSRTDLFVATHSRSDGSFPTQELRATTERIKAIIASDPTSTQRDLDHDPVAQVCGRDRRGRVRGMGDGISKTTIIASTPYMEEARAAGSALADMKASMAEMKQRLDEERAFRMSMKQEMAEIRQQIARQGQPTHFSPNTATYQAHHQSGEDSSLRQDSAPTPQTEQICHLTDIRGRVVARGQLMRANADIPPECVKVILDGIEVPTADLFGDDRTFRDVGLGEILVWPRVLTKT